MNVYLLNDTSRGYSGSYAAMQSIVAEIESGGNKIIGRHICGSRVIDGSLLDKSDLVLVNGEGTVHHQAPAANFLMDCLRSAQKAKKRTFLINTVLHQKVPYYPDVFQNLTFLSVRESLSAEQARANGGRPIVLADSCVGYLRLNKRKLVEINDIAVGSVRSDSGYFGILNHLKYPRVYVPHHSVAVFETLIGILRSCKLYITGQHHGIYGAALAEIPFLPIPSNSHKIEGILKWFQEETGKEIPICRSREDVDKYIPWALGNDVFQHFSAFLKRQEFFNCAHLTAT